MSSFFFLAAVFNLLLVLSSGFIETSANVIPALVGGKNTVSLMNLVHFFFSLGAFITPVLIGLFLTAGGGWKTVILAAAVPTVILGIFFLFVTFSHLTSAGKEEKDSPSTPPNLSGLLSNRAVILGCLTMFLYVGGELGFSAWIVNYLEKKLFFPKIQAAFGMSIFWIGIMAGRMSLSFLSRRFSSLRLIIASVILSLAGGILFLFSRELSAVYPLLFIIGLSMAGGYPVTMAEINSRFPGQTGRVSGILTFGAGLGAMIFLWLMGFTAEHSGMSAAMSIPFVLMAAMAVTFSMAMRE